MREVTVKRYRCDFCPKGLASKSAMRNHESQCWKNPAAKSCGSCAHFEPFSYPDEPEYCAIEADSMGEWATGKPKPRQCHSWSEKGDS